VAQGGVGGDTGDVEGAEIDAGLHGAALDVVDRPGQAVDAHHLGGPSSRRQRLQDAERHDVVRGPDAVDLGMLGQQPRHFLARRSLLEIADA
jgi:hypothetical protein